ncbi:TetR/AcrR family transcriptional regulator [Paraconexibacter algicola]|uniref:TetR/AcrR family transcriptional regulator n=1 Tax=Paraconexibacter algicola TaxID=2133960 RepID=A0A2T4UNC9_9ACTN|nr:TetR/AcrR family transcriptional regulator [Paraconexibacter algicola]PTL60750.1 TetR/AcrR family transcriptional regulator [Paraconexibacter algicola]
MNPPPTETPLAPAPTPGPARGARRAARTRAAILDAAEAAFRVDGYRGTRMEDVAAAADVAVGSIYNHFGDKDGLYHALAERSADLFGRYLDAAYAIGGTPLEQVMACGDAYLRFHLEHPGAFRFLAFDGVEAASSGAVADPELAARLTAKLAVTLDGFRAKIQEAMDTGEVRADLDARRLSRFLWGAWNGVVALGLRDDELALTDADIEATILTGRRLVVEGLVAPAARDGAGDARARLVSIVSPDQT